MKASRDQHSDRKTGSRTAMFGVFAYVGVLAFVSGCPQPVPVSDTPGAVTLFFDGADAQDGDTEFTFQGASFSGGMVRTLGNPSLYGSGRFSYEVSADSAVSVTFASPVDFLELVLIDSGGSTVLTAFDAAGNEVGSINGGTARAAQTVNLTSNAVRVEATHTGTGSGWIDNFSFRIVSP